MSTRQPRNRPAEKPTALRAVTDLPNPTNEAVSGDLSGPSERHRTDLRVVDLPAVALTVEAGSVRLSGLDRLLYSIPDAAELLSQSRAGIYNLIRARRLHCVAEGRRTLIPATSLAEYVALLQREAESPAHLKAVS